MSFSGTKGWITKPPPGTPIDPFHPLSQELVCQLLFNEGAGSRAYDISGHGNHGTLKNMAPNAQDSGWCGNRFGGGLQFDGVNAHVQIEYNGSLRLGTGDFTFELMVKTSTSFVGNKVFVGIYQGGGDIAVWLGGVDDAGIGKARFSVRDSDGVSVGSGNSITTINDGNRHCLAGVKNGNNVYIYVDGILENSGTGIHTGNFDSDKHFLVGAFASDSPSFLVDSLIDGVHIYKCALTAADCKQLCHDPFCNLLRAPIRQYNVPAAIMNQFQKANIGADLYDGGIIA